MIKTEAIRILTTGGTIDKIYFDALSEFKIGDPSVHFILGEANINQEFVVESLFKKDSLELTDDDRELIKTAVLRSQEKRIVVTHGTDTMEQSARYLGELKDRVVVFTGSLEPARQRTTDAIYNLASAMTAVQLLSPGSYVAMNGQVFTAAQVKKDRKLRRFISADNNDSVHSTL